MKQLPSNGRNPAVPQLYSLCFIGIILVALGISLFYLWDQEAFLEWKRSAGVWPFFIALTLLPALGIPTTPFFVLAGALFSLSTALIGTALSLAVNLAISYWLVRRYLRQIVVSLLRRFRYELPVFTGDEAFKLIFLVRIAPGLPFFLKNYATAMMGISFIPYMAISWTISFVYAVGFIVLGDSLIHHDLNEGIWAAVLLSAILITFWVARRQFKRSTVVIEPVDLDTR